MISKSYTGVCLACIYRISECLLKDNPHLPGSNRTLLSRLFSLQQLMRVYVIITLILSECLRKQNTLDFGIK